MKKKLDKREELSLKMEFTNLKNLKKKINKLWIFPIKRKFLCLSQFLVEKTIKQKKNVFQADG